MTNAATESPIGYFGKIPSRDDFIKATTCLPLIEALDNWLAQGMELLAADPRWKFHYDEASPVHFAFLGPHSQRAAAGHLVASRDQSGRRFPFLAVSAIRSARPTAFTLHSPTVLSRLWTRLEAQTRVVLSAGDASESLHALCAGHIVLDTDASGHDAAFEDFLAMHTLGSIGTLLAEAGFSGSVRQLMLGLGMLLQPVLTNLSSRLDKSLLLPLPNEPLYRYLVAAYWMHLIAPFLERAEFELSLFLVRRRSRPVMVLGFSGASARIFQAIIDPAAGADHHIAFDDADWVDRQLQSANGMGKLAAILSEPTLSLQAARSAFLETFLGA